MTAALADLPLFAPGPAEADLVPEYLGGLSEKVIAFWLRWEDTDEGQAIKRSATDVALELLKSGQSRLFIDDIVWEVRRRTQLEVNNTARAPLARWLMHTYPKLRGCFTVRKGKTGS